MGQLPWHAPPRGQPRTRTERLCCAAAPLGGRTQLWVACALGQPAARPRRTAGCLNRASRLRRHSVWCSGTAQSNANPCRLIMKTRLKQALSGPQASEPYRVPAGKWSWPLSPIVEPRCAYALGTSRAMTRWGPAFAYPDTYGARTDHDTVGTIVPPVPLASTMRTSQAMTWKQQAPPF